MASLDNSGLWLNPPMLNPDDIQLLCQRMYPAFLKSVVTCEQFFPLDIRFGRPSTTDEWEKLRREITTLAKGKVGYRIEWAETNTRRWGRQKFPQRDWFDVCDAAPARGARSAAGARCSPGLTPDLAGTAAD